MTPDEVALLKYAGQIFVDNFSRMTPGFYFLLALLTLHTLLKKHSKTAATWVLGTMLAILFSITTTYVCLYVAISFNMMIGALIDNTDLELIERFEVADSSNLRLNLALTWISGNGNGFVFIFGDSIVVWRAWAVWSDHQSVIILPALTLLATFATFLTLGVIQTIESTVPSIIFGTIGALLVAGSALSIATNLIAVLLIGLKAYLIWFSQHWKFMKHTLGVGASASGKVLMFLTESGVVYVIFQIINFILSMVATTDVSPLDEAANIWNVIIIIFSAAYPSLVILIVYNQHSITRLTEGSTAGSRNVGTHISFARSPPQQGMTVTDSIMIRSQVDNGFHASVAGPTEGVPEV
ncbi:hypothetical protein C8J56DRAFT_891732 [Mycena floridula]|nr:hypothetical protein C8J56DRAFT_891732 [Mycena floridula]